MGRAPSHSHRRAEYLVKSGGEWISSVDLDGAIMGYPRVLEAAVIDVATPSGRSEEGAPCEFEDYKLPTA